MPQEKRVSKGPKALCATDIKGEALLKRGLCPHDPHQRALGPLETLFCFFC